MDIMRFLTGVVSAASDPGQQADPGTKPVYRDPRTGTGTKTKQKSADDQLSKHLNLSQHGQTPKTHYDYNDLDETSNIVMIAIDPSPHSEAAFDYYIRNLHRDGNEIQFFHAKGRPHMSFSSSFTMYHGSGGQSQPSSKDFQKFMADKEKQDKELQEKFVYKLRGMGIKNSLKVVEYEHGTAGKVIVNYANEIRPTVIVMGSRGLGALQRAFLGSVSHYVLEHARSPVLICPHGKMKVHHKVKTEKKVTSEDSIMT